MKDYTKDVEAIVFIEYYKSIGVLLVIKFVIISLNSLLLSPFFEPRMP